MSENAAACPRCGSARTVVCQECGAQVSAGAKGCPNCGCPVVIPQYQGVPRQQYGGYRQPVQTTPKSKTTAGILALFLGGWGIDLFYCGKAKAGLVALLITLFTGIGGAILALVRCIRMFTYSQEKFEQRYVYSENEFPLT